MVRCPGRCLWLPLFRVFGLLRWRGLFLVLLGLFGVVVLFVLAGFPVLCFLLLVASPHVILDRYARIFLAFTCTTKAFIIIGLVCLCAD